MQTRCRPLGMALVYLLIAAVPVWQTVRHGALETGYYEQVCALDNFSNTATLEVAKTVPVFGPFVSRHFHLPSATEAEQAQAKIPGLVQRQAEEKKAADFWSWLVLAVSLVYFAAIYAGGGEDRPGRTLLGLTLISLVFFAVGITAPAMVVVILFPKNPMFSSFVLHCDTRSILSIISELFTTRHWLVAAALTLFSILVPLVKAVLTLFAVATPSLETKSNIEAFLDLIGKWSMSDVFGTAIILAHFAIASNDSTKAYLFRGFYYFLGYCLVSMITTSRLKKDIQKKDV